MKHTPQSTISSGSLTSERYFTHTHTHTHTHTEAHGVLATEANGLAPSIRKQIHRIQTDRI